MNLSEGATRLEYIVEGLIQEHRFDTFRKYWEIYKETARISDVSAAHIVSKPRDSYLNVAIMGEGLVVDIEGEDHPGDGALHVDPLKIIAGILISTEPLVGFPKLQGASLMVVTKLMGEPNTGPYWGAWSPDEEDTLKGFARSLRDGLSNS